MGQTTKATLSDSSAKLSQAAVYAERANNMMRSLGVMPSPRNYAVFFACAAGQPTELVREVETSIAAKAPMTEEFMEMLYANHLAEAQTREVHNSALNAKKILNDMMQNIALFADDANAIGRQMSEKLTQLDPQASEEVLRMFATALVDSTTMIQSSSETVTTRLAGAQQEIVELRETLARVIVESERDFLTGSYNRKTFDRRLQEATEEAKKKSSELTLLMIDIDHFKQFNDNYGHLIGDEVLKIVAKTLADLLKGSDSIARYGGEEFAVVLPATPISGGMVVAEAIRQSIASRELKRKSTGENFGTITVSIGVATFRPNAETPQDLVRRADKALYESKHQGRNRVTRELAEAAEEKNTAAGQP